MSFRLSEECATLEQTAQVLIGPGPTTFIEGLVNVAFAGTASYGLFDFVSPERYIIDNVEGAFGSTEVVPEPASLALLRFAVRLVVLGRVDAVQPHADHPRLQARVHGVAVADADHPPGESRSVGCAHGYGQGRKRGRQREQRVAQRRRTDSGRPRARARRLRLPELPAGAAQQVSGRPAARRRYEAN